MKKKTFLFSSIKTKLTLAMFAVAAIPLIVAISLTYYTTTKNTEATTKDTLDWSAWYLQANINNLFEKTKTSLSTLAISDSVIDFLTTGGSEEEAKRELIETNKQFDDENQIVLSNIKGMMVLRSDDSKFADIHDRDYWIGASKGEATCSGVIVSKSTNSRILCYAVPVFQKGRNVV